MTDILDKYPTPWKIIKVKRMNYYRVESPEYFQPLFWGNDLELLEYIVEAVNNSARPRITDTKCECDCGWKGNVGNCWHGIDDDGELDGELSCPRCQSVIEVIV